MALTLTALRLLARSHAQNPFEGPVLTFGRQAIIATLADCEAAIREAGLEPHPLPPEIPRGPNVPAFQTGPTSAFTNDVCFFWLLCGSRIETLDVSDYEDADHIHDLNRPIPDALKDRFGLVIDGGTMEHVFDVAQVLRNIKALVREGGRVIHMNPMNNWAEHGYYQISPTLYHDFYVTNGFAFSECLVIGVRRGSAEGMYDGRSGAWRWSPERPSAQITSREMLTTFFEAKKVEKVADRIPQQGEAASGASSSQLGGTARAGGGLGRAKARLLETVPSAGWAVLIAKRLLGRDLSSKPWGLEHVGRF
ncbi:hypothetical protein SH591_10675 [Sphingomonas sp. LY54]|uniref:hypothetical protein n=1 Tax=Sphingomonas sp. LY54 TaxID=3095343 RepID=UPI002D79E89F|nr:hypothetical protein [Sphingomonas sp. LY54]WRP27582.1 hypothetical protein SH591_10675 [Sphingomonas sp. LY54]